MLSDRIVVEVTSDPGASFLDSMIALVEGASRQKTPNEVALTILLAALTAIFLIVTVTLSPFSVYTGEPVEAATLIALLVCLIPTTIGALLSAIGIAGMDRAVRANVLVKSGRAVEVAGDVDTLLLDKTVSSNPNAKRLIRRGSRVAGRMNTDWFAVYVETPREAPDWISATAQRRIAENLQFAKELGAEVASLEGTDVVRELARFARENNVTYVVMGHTERSRLQEFLRGSVINRLFRELGDVDIQLVP